MSITRNSIPLDHLIAPNSAMSLGPVSRKIRAETLYSLLNNGWVEITYRNGKGQTTTRTATRNPAIVRHYAGDEELQALRLSDHYTASILYYDFARGGIRSFNTDNVLEIGIAGECPEIAH
jgi:hypothetical protein